MITPLHSGHARKVAGGDHLAHIPELECLIFAVCRTMAPISTRCHVREALKMAGQDASGGRQIATRRPGRCHGGGPEAAPVPELEQSIVRCGIHKLAAHIGDGNAVHVIRMRADALRDAVAGEIVYVQARVVGARKEEPPTRGEADGPDAEVSVVTQADRGMHLVEVLLRSHVRVSTQLHEVHIGRDARIREAPRVGRERCIRYRPAQIVRIHVLDELPRRRLVHPHSPVLESAREETAVVRVLARVPSALRGVHETHAAVGTKFGERAHAVIGREGGRARAPTRLAPAAADRAGSEQSVQARHEWALAPAAGARLRRRAGAHEELLTEVSKCEPLAGRRRRCRSARARVLHIGRHGD
mmetsp:Transcript_7625/g.20842  ORF Transcript_7625/g.20842 Transcript_7625/m.20842 type:complete len:358 (-) Transcript_7625:145-1218(-)